MPTPIYEIFALRYAHLAERNQGSNLIFPDDHTAPMPLDFFVWVVKGNGRVIMLDTGFDPESAARRGRAWLRSPIDALSSIGPLRLMPAIRSEAAGFFRALAAARPDSAAFLQGWLNRAYR